MYVYINVGYVYNEIYIWMAILENINNNYTCDIILVLFLTSYLKNLKK